MANSFTYKLTGESELFSFDYSQVLQPAETISSAACTVLVMSGIDPTPSAIMSGSPVISGSKVSQRILDGLSEVTYRLNMSATTSYGNIITVVGDLPIYDSSLV